jgi:flavin reductase (DIM6/NTAB) family NADH-FMN oxidoreductase RutF
MPEKVKLGPRPLVYPMPAFLVGADVDGKPNFMAVAWGGIACSRPPMVSVALQHHRYTYKGIKEKGTFSINIPSQEQVTQTDYCGIVSGAKTDKNQVCGFKIFYGKLETAPMIEQCPLNLECKVVHILDLGSHAFIIGEVMETYVNTDCLTGGEPDASKIKPFIYSEGPLAQYYSFGEILAPAFNIGRKLKSS